MPWKPLPIFRLPRRPRPMNLRKRISTSHDSGSSALNDILFILLFFFLIISTLANPNLVKVSVPRAATDSKARQTVVVSIDTARAFYVGTRRVAEDSLEPALAAAISKSSDSVATVAINADSASSVAELFVVMRAAQSLGVRTVLAVNPK